MDGEEVTRCIKMNISLEAACGGRDGEEELQDE